MFFLCRNKLERGTTVRQNFQIMNAIFFAKWLIVLKKTYISNELIKFKQIEVGNLDGVDQITQGTFGQANLV